jgi:hypothetical protein
LGNRTYNTAASIASVAVLGAFITSGAFSITDSDILPLHLRGNGKGTAQASVHSITNGEPKVSAFKEGQITRDPFFRYSFQALLCPTNWTNRDLRDDGGGRALRKSPFTLPLTVNRKIYQPSKRNGLKRSLPQSQIPTSSVSDQLDQQKTCEVMVEVGHCTRVRSLFS